MKKDGIKFLNKCIPVSFSKNEEKVICEYKNNETGEVKKEEFDTVLLATGRKADCSKINIESTGVKLAKSGKIIVDKFDKTNIENILISTNNKIQPKGLNELFNCIKFNLKDSNKNMLK